MLFSLRYLNQFYSLEKYEKVMGKIRPEDLAFINQVSASGKKVKEREVNFFEQIFDKKDMTNVF